MCKIAYQVKWTVSILVRKTELGVQIQSISSMTKYLSMWSRENNYTTKGPSICQDKRKDAAVSTKGQNIFQMKGNIRLSG